MILKSRANCRFLQKLFFKTRRTRGPEGILKSKVVDNFHERILRNNENKKKFIRVAFTAFQSICNLLFSKDENRYSYCVSWCRNNKIWKFWLYSNAFFDIFPRRGRQKVVLHAKVWLEETNDTITIRSPSGDTDIVILVTSLLWKFRW